MARDEGHHEHEALKHGHKHFHVTSRTIFTRERIGGTCSPPMVTNTITQQSSTCTSPTGTWRRNTGERRTSTITLVPLSHPHRV
jgi:hypothetical protein